MEPLLPEVGAWIVVLARHGPPSTVFQQIWPGQGKMCHPSM